MGQLFGFQINRKTEKKGQSPVPPLADEPVSIAAGGYFGTYVDTDATARNEYELIRRYRDMALHPEVDSAVDEIVNEFVVSDNNESTFPETTTWLQKNKEPHPFITNFTYLKHGKSIDHKI